MSPQQNYEIVRYRQQEIAVRTRHADHVHDIRSTGSTRRSVFRRLGQAAATLGVCLAAVTTLAMNGAHANPRPAKSGHLSAQQLAQNIRALEKKGYVPVSCTIHGTLMRNYSTGQSLTLTF
jgi:negative regulator of sigma E activity